ncbi:MAG: type II secretion system ATPase GspE [Pseudomonadales bacterium]|nr:type II secretion system ATPase GspE [Pseudomonadales bacterium]NRA18636.1 type II secretion system ATPase GspE [Oceanospirillaceae bacterium]
MHSGPFFSFIFARKNSVLALVDNGSTEVYYSEQTSLDAFMEIQRCCPEPINYQLKQPQQLDDDISISYQAAESSLHNIDELNDVIDLDELVENMPENADLLDVQDDAPIIRLINGLFARALQQNASDIHIETFEHSMSVRFRVDGVLKEVLTPHRKAAPLLNSRIKVMAKLDIAEKRVPQDGRVSLRMAGKALDVRVSTIPSMYGERIVMRLLDTQAVQLDLTHLGMPEHCLKEFTHLLNQPNGIILVTGPTGSGKTTTLYAGLTGLNTKSRNILTIEDPVEYALEGIGQTPVNEKSQMSFAKGLRAILRQDPDIVMIGEIRDPETAQIAVQASLTGHLVLSTLHTNDSFGAITRLKDIGVEPYLIASSLKGILAQRLVRKLCSECKKPEPLILADAIALGDASLVDRQVYSAQGCAQCHHTGYAGRQGLYELLVVDQELTRQIHANEGEPKMRQHMQGRFNSMLDEGTMAVLAGITSTSEVLRSVRDSLQDAIL